MYELIAQIILMISLLGMVVILFRKIPILINLSPEAEISQPNFLLRAKNRILIRLKSFPLNNFLQKILLRFKIVTLKTENKTSVWIEKLRQKAKKEEKESQDISDNYWEQLKK